MLHRELQKRCAPLADDFWQFCTDSYMFPLKQLLVIRNSIALVKMSMLFGQRHAAGGKGTQHRLQASSIHVILPGPPSVTPTLVPWRDRHSVSTVVEGVNTWWGVLLKLLNAVWFTFWGTIYSMCTILEAMRGASYHWAVQQRVCTAEWVTESRTHSFSNFVFHSE